MVMTPDLEAILAVMNAHRVDAILIGGMNFFLKFKTTLTYDVDLWIEDTPANRARCEAALAAIDAQWGHDEASWGPVAQLSAGWLERQQVFCLGTSAGAVDIFRSLVGVANWQSARHRAELRQSPGGENYVGMSDEDMLACQLALAHPERKQDRIAALTRRIQEIDGSKGNE